MQTKKFFLLSVVFLGTFCFLSIVSAQTSNSLNRELKQEDLLTVNVYDAKIEKQVGNDINISFNISNRDGVQPQVVYTVELVKDDGSNRGKIIVDQKVYSDVVTLGAGESVRKKILYQAPKYLNGSFGLVIEIRSQGPFKFGSFPVAGSVSLLGDGQNITIDSENCFLTVNGDENKYKLNDTIDIGTEEILSLHCKLKSTFANSLKIIPVFTTHNFSKAGEIISEEKRAEILLNNNELDFVLDMPKMSTPQLYDTVLSFVNSGDEKISAPLEIAYILRGEIVNILNLSIEKNKYNVGENANLFFLWSGVKNAFASDKVWRNNQFLLSKKRVIIDIYNKKSERCTESFKRDLTVENGGGAEMAIIPVEQNCEVAKIQAKIIDDDGKVFVDNNYSIQAENTSSDIQKEIPIAKIVEKSGAVKEDTPVKLIVVFGVILLVFLLTILMVLFKRKNSKLMMFLFFLPLFALVATGSVKAMGFYPGTGALWHYNPNPPGFSFEPIPCPASSSLLLGCGSFSGGGVVANNCAVDTCVGTTCWAGLGLVNGTKLCDNDCAANTCTTTTCWNSYATVNGTKVCDNGCAADTCVAAACWNNLAWVEGTKICADNSCAENICDNEICWNNIVWISGTKEPTFDSYSCNKLHSTDCSIQANCGKQDTITASCTAINSCSGSTDSRPLAECSSCLSSLTTQCPACPVKLKVSNWQEVAPK